MGVYIIGGRRTGLEGREEPPTSLVVTFRIFYLFGLLPNLSRPIRTMMHLGRWGFRSFFLLFQGVISTSLPLPG